jgi:hypothetical protein
MASCIYCERRAGKRACPALGGEICPQCCGKHRLVEIECPPDCRWLGGLAVVKDGGARGFTREDYGAAIAKLEAYGLSRDRAAYREALAFLIESADDPENPVPEWMESVARAHAMYGHRSDGGLRAVDRFVTAFGRSLPPGEVAALVALQHSWASVFEVTAIRAGAGLTLRDLVDDGAIEVREATATGHLHPGDALFAWLMPVEDAVELTGAAIVIPRHLVDEVVDALYDELEARGVTGPARAVVGELGDVVADVIREAAARRPQLVTTDGEDVVFGEAHYRVLDVAGVIAGLDAIEELDRDGSVYLWLDRAPRSGREPTILGQIRRRGDALVFETNSRERLARGRALLEGALGACIAHRADTFQDVDSVRGGGTASSRAEMPPELEAELLGQVLRDHYLRWLDEPVPAFGDRTPRAAAKTKRGRAQVTALLDDFERSSRDQPGATPELWNGLRRALGIAERVPRGAGLTYDAARAPDPRAWLDADEDARVHAVRSHHADLAGHVPTPNPGMHDLFHVIVENQLAAGDSPESAATLDRLVREDVPRHDAIHAVASIVAAEMHGAMTEQRTYDHDRVARDLARLRAADWRRGR